MEGEELSEAIGLDEIVESRLRELLVSVWNGSSQSIESELKSLAELIDAYGRKDELLENLLDPLTKAGDRQQTYAKDQTYKLRVERERIELERLHDKSRQLLERSIQLLLQGSKQLYERHNGPEYSPELCGYCQGFGRRDRSECPACLGQRLILVHQPALACPRCVGKGKAATRELKFEQDRCIVCRGVGWVFTRRKRTPARD